MKKIVKRFIAAVLAMVIMFTDCVNGFAVEMETECNEKAEIIEELSVEEPTHVLFEVEELREQSAKQYRLSDGTILAAQYGMDVHYEDESGKWKEIDNRFIYDSAVTTTDFDGYSTVEGAIGYKFAPSIQNGEILKVSDEKYSVGFELLAPSNVNQRSLTETNTLSLANAPLTFLDGEVLNEEEINSIDRVR